MSPQPLTQPKSHHPTPTPPPATFPQSNGFVDHFVQQLRSHNSTTLRPPRTFSQSQHTVPIQSLTTTIANNTAINPPTKRRKLRELISPPQINEPGTTRYSGVVAGVMLAKDREHQTGVNHFKRFRNICNMPHHISHNENITAVFMDFIGFMMVELERVKSYDSVKKYVSHVKMWLVQKTYVQGPMYGQALQLPNRSSSTYSLFTSEVRAWFTDLDEGEKGKRIPTTTGVLQYLVHGENGLGGNWDISSWTQRRLWASELICLFSGTRKGELLVQKNTGRNTNKDCKVSDVHMSENFIQIFVHDKVKRKRLPVFIDRKEVEPIIQRFGPHFDIFAIMKTILAEAKELSELLFVHQDGSPITYNQFWKAITKICLQAKLPKGAIGGHGGRIRLATLLEIRGTAIVDIKGRGRWASECWQIYVRMFMERPPANAYWFRIGQLNIDLSGFPPVSEFRK